MLVMEPLRVDCPFQGQERHGCCSSWAVAALREFCNPLFQRFGKTLRRRGPIDQAPRLCALGAHALGGGAEEVGEVAADHALVD